MIDERWDADIAVVSATGVVDMLSAPQLDEAIRTALGKKPRALVVDFTAVDFLASAGMGVLVAIHDEVSPAVNLTIVADGPATSRPLKLLGIADLVPLHATLDEALAAVAT
ncbi:anti-sigma-factor antagonist [Mycolicibacterium thermoresistibile ATCC 19527]|uniref:Anti-sigma-factor antagonist n=2 Tax=Mycolicibacterium thermoresistibile TaxID=1797 RepID=G7CM45_MYCT3|nr:anti-sigma-factor antagonist [Mycolicibacterium thermoresistibile ATCC 19527]GAT13320.1 anti-sigma-factor antagonist [Mycolicibacterium thermoresistibile]